MSKKKRSGAGRLLGTLVLVGGLAGAWAWQQ